MKNALFLVFNLLVLGLSAQVIYPYRTCPSPKELSEFSGIVKISEDLLAGINDSGNPPVIYFLDSTGNLMKERRFSDISNTDWEELIYDKGILHICDLGDNMNVRKETVIWKYDLKNDTLIGSSKIQMAEKKIPLAESRKHYDCEAGYIYKDKYYFFTKTHASPYTGTSYQYTMPVVEKDGKINAVDSFCFGTRGLIHCSLTGAAISPSGKIRAFISCTHVWFSIGAEEKFPFRQAIMDFDFDGLTQKEAITFTSDYRFVVADERSLGIMGGRLYFFDLKPYLIGNKKYVRTEVESASLKKLSGKSLLLKINLEKEQEKITLILVDQEAKPVFVYDVDAVRAKKGLKISLENSRFPFAKNAYGFWLVSDYKILYTSKIN